MCLWECIKKYGIIIEKAVLGCSFLQGSHWYSGHLQLSFSGRLRSRLRWNSSFGWPIRHASVDVNCQTFCTDEEIHANSIPSMSEKKLLRHSFFHWNSQTFWGCQRGTLISSSDHCPLFKVTLCKESRRSFKLQDDDDRLESCSIVWCFQHNCYILYVYIALHIFLPFWAYDIISFLTTSRYASKPRHVLVRHWRWPLLSLFRDTRSISSVWVIMGLNLICFAMECDIKGKKKTAATAMSVNSKKGVPARVWKVLCVKCQISLTDNFDGLS